LYWKEDWGWEMSTERQQTEDTHGTTKSQAFTLEVAATDAVKKSL